MQAKYKLKPLTKRQLKVAPSIIQLMHTSKYARDMAPEKTWKDIKRQHPEYFEPLFNSTITSLPVLTTKQAHLDFWYSTVRIQLLQHKTHYQLSIKQIARIFNKTETTVCNWIIGKHAPTNILINEIFIFIHRHKKSYELSDTRRKAPNQNPMETRAENLPSTQ